MAFRVKPTTRAKRDLDVLLKRLLDERAGEAGLRSFQGLKAAINTLAEFSGALPAGVGGCHLSFRGTALTLGHKPHIYRVLFTVKGDVVVVLHIRHGRQQTLAWH